jgi:hypothetical protein
MLSEITRQLSIYAEYYYPYKLIQDNQHILIKN